MYDGSASGALYLDTPRQITDAAGNIVWQWDNTDPFGNNAPNENPNGAGQFSFPLRFPGQYADKETNTYYNYFRDYDPATGRYVQSDPIGLYGGSNSPYVYAFNNPLRWVDPLGLDPRDPEPGLESVCIECIIVPAARLPNLIRKIKTWCDASDATKDTTPASTPTGQRGSPMDVPPGTNTPATIGGRDYSGHALDQMQGRGITPSVVQDTIANGVQSSGNTAGTVVSSNAANGVTVVTNSQGRVVTVITTGRAP